MCVIILGIILSVKHWLGKKLDNLLWLCLVIYCGAMHQIIFVLTKSDFI